MLLTDSTFLILFFFAICGVLAILRLFISAIEVSFSPKSDSPYLVIPIKHKQENIEFYIRTLFSDMSLMKKYGDTTVVVIDHETDAETTFILKSLADELSFVYLTASEPFTF